MERNKVVVSATYANKSRTSHYLVIDVNKEEDVALVAWCETGIVKDVPFDEFFERCFPVYNLRTGSAYMKYETDIEGAGKNG